MLHLLACLMLFLPCIVWAQDITSDLVAWYKLNDTTGLTAVDSSASGSTLDLIGTPTWSAGHVGGALTFDGAGDYAWRDNPNANLPTGATAAFTLAGWIQASAYTDLSHLFGFGFLPSTQLDVNIHRGILAFNNNYYFWGAGADWDSGIAFDTDSVFHHIAFTVSATTITFYRDGTNRASAARPAALATAGSEITLGERHQAGTDFIGTLDDVRIYARALTQTDITALVAYTEGAVARRRVIMQQE